MEGSELSPLSSSVPTLPARQSAMAASSRCASTGEGTPGASPAPYTSATGLGGACARGQDAVHVARCST